MNDNGLMDRQSVRQFTNLGYRMTRYLNAVPVSAGVRGPAAGGVPVPAVHPAERPDEDLHRGDGVFLPLSLLAGWYGMNFANMPELHWNTATRR